MSISWRQKRNYELKHFDIMLLHFSAIDDSNIPEIEVLSLDKRKKYLLSFETSVLTQYNGECLRWLLNFKLKCCSRYNRTKTI